MSNTEANINIFKSDFARILNEIKIKQAEVFLYSNQKRIGTEEIAISGEFREKLESFVDMQKRILGEESTQSIFFDVLIDIKIVW